MVADFFLKKSWSFQMLSAVSVWEIIFGKKKNGETDEKKVKLFVNLHLRTKVGSLEISICHSSYKNI